MKNLLSKFLVGAALLCSTAAVKAQGLEGIIVEDYYTITAADAAVAVQGSYPLVAGMKVYRVYVDMAPNYRLNTVFGSPVGGGGVSPNPLDFSTTTTFWNDDNFGGAIPSQTRRMPQGTAFDTYITIGTTGTAGGAAGCGSNAQQTGVLRTADTDGNLTLCSTYPGFTGNDGNIPGSLPALTYNLGGLINLTALTGSASVFQVINDAWATLPNSTGVDPTGTNRQLIGQFTTNGTFTFHINVTLALPAPSTALETYVWQTAGAGEVVSPFLSFPPCIAPAISSTTSNSPVCSSGTLNLGVVATGNAPLTYAWTGTGTISNGNTANASVTGAATGNYNIAVSNACGNANQNVAVVVTPAPSATISYLGSPYCSNGGTASVNLVGTPGGTYSSTAGLSINSSTGAVTLGASTAGTYTVTYTIAADGGCAQVQATAPITITAAPNATINYVGSPYCTSGGTVSPTLTGTAGGTYSSTVGLTINAGTGDINTGTSTPGTYTVTYSVAAGNGCAAYTTTASVTINAGPTAAISYVGSPFCSNAGAATVTLTGTTGGTFSSTSGLSINASTGAVNIATSTAGTYTVTYTLAPAGGCAAFTTTASISITAAPNATISYVGSPFCSNGTSASVTLTGTAGGSYGSTAGLSINSSTGAVNIATSTVGTYTVTYTVAAANGCAAFSTTSNIAINAASTWYADTDGDGFGDAGASQFSCTQPLGFVANSTDLCTADPLKQAPGLCGCGVVDIDANSNGICDSQELTPLVQLGIVEAQGQLEFRLKPDAAYTGLVSATVVTVRWQTTPGVSVGTAAVLVDPTWNTSVGTVVAQGVATNGIYSYATFATFGNSNLGAGNGLSANTEKAFFRVPYTNTSGSCITFEVIDDTYQDNQNLLWYISLAGQNKTNGYITGKTSTTGYPDAVCQNITVPLSAAGSASITAAQVSASNPLNCGVVNNAISVSNFSCSNTGINPVTLTATYANGTFKTCVSNVTVIDNLAPVVTAVAGALNTTLQCSDASGLSTALALVPTATDNCAGATLVLLSDITTAGNCPSAYTRVRTWKFTDASSNSSANYVQTISVIDNTAPVITTAVGALNSTLQCSNASGLAAALAMQPAATDNCSAPSITLVSDVTTGSGCEYVRVRTWTFTDACGNTSTTYTQTITITASVRVSVRVFLDGPFVPASVRMKDDLRVAGLIPTAQPYTPAPFGYTGTETVSPAVLAVTDADNAIVDWVLVELRDNSTPNLVIARRAALVQRDGDVVDLDGSSALAFPAIGTNSYRIAVRHRNHLGAMTANGIALSNITTLVDFTSNGLATYGTDATKISGTSRVLWAGNALVDNRLRYTGANNDRDAILVYIGGVVPTNTIFNVYASQDVNMNGNVRYTGSFNDRDPILFNIGGSSVTTQRFEQLP